MKSKIGLNNEWGLRHGIRRAALLTTPIYQSLPDPKLLKVPAVQVQLEP